MNKEQKENPCDGCSKCCEYVALEIDEPDLDKKEDIDEIRWYLLHKDVEVFVDNDDSWNIQFNTPCEKLTEEGLCSDYENRPTICRKHSPKNCEKYDEASSYKLLWKNQEDFNQWIKDGMKIPD
ncbi:MAG: YkgJ family cysteine cluster protein [Candidatus Nanoarchaeia archaeon]